MKQAKYYKEVLSPAFKHDSRDALKRKHLL